MNRIHIAVLAAALAIIGTVTAAEVRQLQAELASTTAAYQESRQRLGTALYGLMGAYNERVPRCPEDAVLVGAGDFEQGQWDRYECGPAVDDYTPD